MNPTGNLFADLPRSRPRRVLMHVIDAGNSCGADGGPLWAEMQCKKCLYRAQFTYDTVTEAKRGSPCPNCNGVK